MGCGNNDLDRRKSDRLKLKNERKMMGATGINISKNNDRVVSEVITNVFVARTTDFFIAGNVQASQLRNMGLIEKAGVTLEFKGRNQGLIDGTDHSRGFDITLTISALQFYDLYELEKLNNQVCYFFLENVKTWVKDVKVQIEGTLKPTAEEGGTIKIIGKRSVKNLRDCIDGNPFGALPLPWNDGTNSSVAGSGGSLAGSIV